MITAFQLASNRILIHYYEMPLRKDGKFIEVPGTDNLIQLKNYIGNIELVIPATEGNPALIIPISVGEIKKIHETIETILNELIAPGNAADYDY